MLPAIEEINYLVGREAEIDKRIVALNKVSTSARRLLKIPGIGPINASYLSNLDIKSYKDPKDFSASLGIVPRQNTTGGRVVLGSITKNGNRQARTMLIQGARALMVYASRLEKPKCRLTQWASNAYRRLGFNKASVALANKLARIAHACIVQGVDYRTQAVSTL